MAKNLFLELCRARFFDDGQHLRLKRTFPFCRQVPGDIVGSRHCQGYQQITICGQRHLVHRVLWLMRTGAWPRGEIDHIDGDRQNNRTDNLRDVSHAINARNRRRRSTSNRSGVTGVCWDSRNRKWRAYITVDGKQENLGRFTDLNDAAKARRQAERP